MFSTKNYHDLLQLSDYIESSDNYQRFQLVDDAFVAEDQGAVAVHPHI